jgi:Tfp pilus assembly protein PilN
VAVREQAIDSLGVTVAPDAGDGAAGSPAGGGRYAAAVALALEGLRTGVVTDLLQSRLVPKKERRVGRWTVWAAVLGVTFAAAIAFAVYDLSSQRREVAEAKSRLDALQPQFKEAQAAIDRTTFAQRWTSTDPKALALLRDVTMAFPEGGRVWATSLILQPDGRVTLTGRATSDQAPGDLLKRLRDSKKFQDVQLGNTGGAGQRGSNETQFTITFRYPGI